MKTKSLIGLIGILGMSTVLVSCGKGELTPRESAIQSMTVTTQKVKNANEHVFINPISASSSSSSNQSTSISAGSSASASTHHKSLSKALGQAKQSPIWKALRSDPSFGRILRAAEENAPSLQTAFGEVDSNVKYLMENLLTNPVENNGVTIYTPDAEAICSNLSPSDRRGCIDLLAKVTIEQHVDSPTSGKLLFKYETKGPFAIGYGVDQYYLEFYLSDALAVIEQLGANNPSSATIVASGTIRFSIAMNGENQASVGYGIMEATEVSITETTSKLTMKVAKAPDALVITADPNNHKGNIALNYGSSEIRSSTRVANTWKDSLLVTSEKQTGNLELTIKDDELESLSIKGFSLGEHGTVIIENDKKIAEMVVESPDTFLKFESSNHDVTTVLIDFNQAFMANIVMAESSTSNLTLKSSATVGTSLSIDTKTDELKVSSGEFKMSSNTSNNATALNFDVTIATGQCANEKNHKFVVYSC